MPTRSSGMPRHFERITALGRALEHFPNRGRRLVRWLSLAIALLSWAASLAASAYAVTVAYNQYYYYGPAAVMRAARVPLAASLLLLFFSVLASVAAYRVWHRAAVFYEHGFAVLNGNRLVALRWEDAADLAIELVQPDFLGLSGRLRHIYRVSGVHGEKAVLDDSIANVERLGGLVRARVTPVIFSRLNNAFNTGQTLRFGPIQISRAEGVQVGPERLAWPQLREMTVQQGWVTFHRKPLEGAERTPLRVPAASVPNVDALLSLVDQGLSEFPLAADDTTRPVPTEAPRAERQPAAGEEDSLPPAPGAAQPNPASPLPEGSEPAEQVQPE